MILKSQVQMAFTATRSHKTEFTPGLFVKAAETAGHAGSRFPLAGLG